ncbi:Undecaprenyl phosphate N,N'-diacetylbacillosamine 1-phosphate transferase [Leuconostoc mesenteroides]|uniref:sugar transferase n=1 Tax=Leuconostoc mesenteroides TaxID=1245 RepID=UPI000CFA35F7|nr:sugar transferase [Leuconostoc mesenteroides]TGD34769.1 sugar transferase [Leuconostoc mesenteroides]SPE14405.1 Undecaprenyl phosphate N,N'-diacetylbacillosamine 1-phosphate transferase [Leuconostoc mesenteroides]SPI59673.1 Undecaprenyl phosphate N,N'-diacetylbacillosamine 1-phosphate transferase [Leuconostoc mesenteroides]
MDTTVLGKTIYKNYIKKIFDLLMATFLIIVLLPVLLVVYIILRVTTDDTVIYKQDRVGQYGKVFQIYKFRTMPKNTPILVGKQRAKIRNRVSKFARFLRSTSIDELPQLVNVIKGDMSLIGPRPVVLQEVALIQLREKSGANGVKPGLTGLAQVNGRKQLNNIEKAKFDAMYADHVTFKADILIVLRTLPIIIERDGVRKFFKKRY